MKAIKLEDATPEEQEDIDTFNALKTLAQSDGGKILIETLTTDIVSVIGTLETQYKILSHTELIGYCASLSERLALLRTLTRANKNLEDLKKLIGDTLAE